MHRNKAFIQNILRSLKQPTKLDDIIQAIPKPRGAVPTFGLPRWKVMPLDSNLPLIPAPKGTYYFSRKKIGQELFTDSRKDAEFNLNDPYNYDIDYSYDPLHDRNLADYFTKKNIQNHMIQHGFLTENLDVICNVKQYNMYRKYLKKLYEDSIKKELRRQAEIHEDRRILARAEKEAEKDLMRIKVRESRFASKNKMNQEFILREEEKLRERRKKSMQFAERLKKIQSNKEENIRKMILEAKLHSENVKRKQALIRDKQRKKIINILLKTAERERKRKKIKQEQISKEMTRKLKTDEEKWKLRCQFQEKQLENERFVLNYAKQRRNQFIDNYNNKINEERKRIKDKMEKTTKFRKCFMARHASGGKKICCKIPKKVHGSKGTKKQSRSMDDLCLMTENCECDEPGNEYCQDQQYK